MARKRRLSDHGCQRTRGRNMRHMRRWMLANTKATAKQALAQWPKLSPAGFPVTGLGAG